MGLSGSGKKGFAVYREGKVVSSIQLLEDNRYI